MSTRSNHPSSDDDDEFFTPPELCARWKISKQKLSQMHQQALLPPCVNIGPPGSSRGRRWRRGDIVAWEAAHREQR